MESFIARQPVFDKTKSVFGYELLFRGGLENCYNFADGDKSTLDVLATTLFHTSFEDMVGGRNGLVNFTRNLLLSDVALLFPKEHLIVEVLETVRPDDEIVAACRWLKGSGYKIALDDFVLEDLANPLLDLADIVKVDFLQARGGDREAIAARLLPRKIVILAEKVETEEDYQQGASSGYSLFQGYFFSKPIVKSMQAVHPSKLACIQMLSTITNPDFDFQELDAIISRDVSLTYRVLRLVNSPFFGFRSDITSTLHALTLLGRSHIRRFISIIAVSTLGDRKPSELVLASLTRARLCEQVAPQIGLGYRSPELFLTGLFSMIDALLDRPMSEILSDLPVSHDVKSALLGEPNMLRNVLGAILCYERAEWDEFAGTAAALGLKDDFLPSIYASTIRWATDLLRTV